MSESENGIIWLSTTHLIWLSHISHTPVVIDNGVIIQLIDKGLIARSDTGELYLTPRGESYAVIANRFAQAVKENPQMSADERASLNFELHRNFRKYLSASSMDAAEVSAEAAAPGR